MPGVINLTVDRTIYQRIGTVMYPHPEARALRPAEADVSSPLYGVLIEWPAEYRWLKLVAAVDDAGVVTPFSDDFDALLALLTKHNMVDSQLATVVNRPGWPDTHSFVAASTSKTNVPPQKGRFTIKMKWFIDTNHESFCSFAQKALKSLTQAGAPAEGIVVNVLATFFHKGAGEPLAQTDTTKIQLTLPMARPAPRGVEYVALDLGNTSSALAAIGVTHTYTEPRLLYTAKMVGPGAEIEIGKLDQRQHSIASEVRIDRVVTWEDSAEPKSRRFPSREHDFSPKAVEWKIGDLVRSEGAGLEGLVIGGAKRMAAVRDEAAEEVSVYHQLVSVSNPKQKVRTQLQRMKIDNRAPLELLGCRLLQHYREASACWPAQLALTYPTTYSRFEYQQLRRAVQKAWLRMQTRRQRPLTPAEIEKANVENPFPDQALESLCAKLQKLVMGKLAVEIQEQDPIIALMIDEASAAAFFYLYRRIFKEMKGGLTAFAYLFERGMNLLLYDCGGGTTDIALVHAQVTNDFQTLVISVRKRSGLRNFGGDNITFELCKLLKAKVVRAIREAKNEDVPPVPSFDTAPQPLNPTSQPAPPDVARLSAKGKELREFINTMTPLDGDDSLVPTRPLEGRDGTECLRRRLDLLRLGEDMKCQLKDAAEVSLPPMVHGTNALSRAILSGDAAADQGLQTNLEAIRIYRWEVDALIVDDVERSIVKCNKLILSELGEGKCDPPEEVDWVVASGNALQYPMIQEMLKHRLDVPFLLGAAVAPVAAKDEKANPGKGSDNQAVWVRYTFDVLNAKGATAKGAALALATFRGRGTMKVEFDSDLANQLPYDVAYQDHTVDRPVWLYREHTHYRKLKTMEPITIPMAALKPGTTVAATRAAANEFSLLRQFPGEDGFSPFLTYEFPVDIQGDLRVNYDDTLPHEFKVVDVTTNNVGKPKMATDESFKAPCQRGDL